MDKYAKVRKLPVGVSDFAEMIQGNYYYVDKSLFIQEVLDKGDKIILIPRPGRFGKTLNMSMLKYFFDCCPGSSSANINREIQAADGTSTSTNTYKELFDSLAISKAGKEYLNQMGQNPVIFLTFKDIKNRDWKTCLDKIMQLIQAEYARHYYLLQWDGLFKHEKDYLNRILDLSGSIADYENSLGNLLIFLNRYYSKRTVILIDEYDEPVHAGYSFGYYEEIINFLRNFLCGALKDTGQYLEKAVITGILRLAKESIFSGLNNPGVYTLLREDFEDRFGFTEQEMDVILKDFELLDNYDEVKKWYNGYRFGSRVIYNPWSIINYLAGKDKTCMPYWVNTSQNEVIELLLSGGGKELKEELELLVSGEPVEKKIEENIVLKDIDKREDLLWSFLLMCGYLKAVAKQLSQNTGNMYVTLAIPNLEVKKIYTGIIENFFTGKIGSKQAPKLIDALLKGDMLLFERILKNIIGSVFSYHDFAAEPERVYHALTAGILVWMMDTHEVKSNRESGYGRYDMMIIPNDPGGIGYVIEFKAVDTREKETIASAAAAALRQIEEKQYETELITRGIQNIKKLAVVFSGKEVFVKESVQ